MIKCSKKSGKTIWITSCFRPRMALSYDRSKRIKIILTKEFGVLTKVFIHVLPVGGNDD